MISPPKMLRAISLVALASRCTEADTPPESVALENAMQHPESWRTLATPGLAVGPGATLSPLDDGALLVGGLGADSGGPSVWRLRADGAEALTGPETPSPRVGHVAVNAGPKVCVWGGRAGGRLVADGACFDIQTARWERLPEGPLSPREAAASVGDAEGFVIWGGRDAEGESLSDGARYTLATRQWSLLPEGPRPRHRGVLAALGARRWVLTGGAGEALALGGDESMRLDPEAAGWSRVAQDLEGFPLVSEAPVWVPFDGGLWVIGRAGVFHLDPEGARFVAHGPGFAGALSEAAVAVSGREAVLAGGRDGAAVRDAVWRLDLTTGAARPGPSLPFGLAGAAAARAGATLFVAGGEGASGPNGAVLVLDRR